MQSKIEKKKQRLEKQKELLISEEKRYIEMRVYQSDSPERTKNLSVLRANIASLQSRIRRAERDIEFLERQENL